MRGSRLRQLIAGGESETVEFKLSLERMDLLARVAASFANSRRGGIILVGLTDEGKIVGVERHLRQHGGSPRRLQAAVRRQLMASIDPSPRLKVRTVMLDGVSLLRIAIRSGWAWGIVPYQCGQIYVRRGARTVEATQDEIAVLERQGYRKRWMARMRRGLVWGLFLVSLFLAGFVALSGFLMADVGRGQVRLADTPRDLPIFRPVFAPDGQTIVVHGYDKDWGNWNLYAISPGGSQLRQLTDHWAHEFVGGFSPDGRWLAYTCHAPDSEICLYDWLTGETQQITQLRGSAEHPVFSPDGEWILFDVSPEKRPQDRDLFVMRPDSSDGHWLTCTPDMRETEPAFSPDGQTIVFVGENETGEVDLYLLNWDGQMWQRLTHDPEVRESRPSFSPDGQWIVYASNQNHLNPSSDRNGEIVVIRSDGSDWHVISGLVDLDPVFAPDGQRIVFISQLRHLKPELYSVSRDDQELTHRSTYRLFCAIFYRIVSLLTP